MKILNGFLSFLFVMTFSLNNPLHLKSLLSPRILRVVTNPTHPKIHKSNQNVSRLSRALQTLKAAQNNALSHKKSQHRHLQNTSVPVLDNAFKLADKGGSILNYIPHKLGYNFTSNPEESASLGLGSAALGYGVYSQLQRDTRFNELNYALQNKYKLNGIYLASLEDENVEITYCNKRLSKILDKTQRHRKNILTKLHFTVGH